MSRPRIFLILLPFLAGVLTRPAFADSPAENPPKSVEAVPLVFVVRPQYLSDHHNTATMFQTGEINVGSFRGGSAVKVLRFENGEKAVTTLLEVSQGIARDLEVSFDAKKILFSMRRDAADDYHIYEMNADGSDLRQLTFAPGVSDIDPIYLPDGRILFASTREPKYCMCNRHIMCNLFVMEGDGANIRQIGHSTLHEGHPALLEDGRVIYDRWEYVDRNFGDAQGLWTTNPDGTNHAVYYGNNTNSPGAVLDARPVPGTPLVICTFSSCHDRPWGAIALLDRRLGIDLAEPVLQTWPAGAFELIGQGNYDTFTRLPVKYEDPYPLSENEFLCARMTGQGEQTGIYLLNRYGGERLLHVEEPGCFDPMPLAPRPVPPAVPPKVELADKDGVFYIADVYVGTGMDRVPRGTVKSVRVVESPEKRFWTPPAWDGGTGQQAPGMAYDDFNNKRILGTAPVEEDGSAAFAVPADTFVYFQLLDAEGRMVQSMRSGTIVRPGERIGCVGCHENRRQSLPAAPTVPLAIRREPSRLEPWHGPPRLFCYTAEVQPVFDKQCVSCHDYGQEAGEKLNLAGDLGLIFNTSYVELRSKGLVRVAGAGPHQTLPPKSWGSYASRLAEVVLGGHGDAEIDKQIRLSAEEKDRILTWIDVNAPYHADYASAYRDHPFGRSPLNQAEVNRLSELTGVNLGDRANVTAVSFTRPEMSVCLNGLEEKAPKEFAEALQLIRLGKERLATRPRMDMPGFVLSVEVEIAQQAKYAARLEEERRNRSAELEGARRFEK